MIRRAISQPQMPQQMIVPRGNDQYIETIEKNSFHHNIFLDCDITDPSNYREMIALIFSAGQDDTIDIFINSIGGQLDTVLSIIESIKITQAHVRAILIGSCHSAVSMLSMYCHEVVVLDSAYSMIHTASFGSSGNTGNVKSHTEFTVKMVEKLLNDTYEGFLTKEELVKVKQGVEIWLGAEDIRKRMELRNKFLQKQSKKTVDKVE